MPPSSTKPRKSYPAFSKSATSPRYPPQRKPNNTILNFFKKSDVPPPPTTTYSSQTRISNFLVRNKRKSAHDDNHDDDNERVKAAADDGLFFDEQVESELETSSLRGLGGLGEDATLAISTSETVEEEALVQEEASAQKRQKLDVHNAVEGGQGAMPARRIGPFVEDSDSEPEVDTVDAGSGGDEDVIDTNRATPVNRDVSPSTPYEAPAKSSAPTPGVIVKTESPPPECLNNELHDERGISCPMCDMPLASITEAEASSHVNQCLDGQLQPHPECSATPETVKDTAKNEPASTTGDTLHAPLTSKRLSHALGSSIMKRKSSALPAPTPGRSASAFTELMNNDVENTAWSAAAADSQASRGKRAVERTCPFYKILPGFSVCVDAFRYGAVEGCNAYFLSHFHSDHYIGLRASWKHGPIYCSKVTASLVHQQLKVDRKYIVPLDFNEKPFEIPETGGARVTMIPANHCPGSSLFLFEKVVGAGQQPKFNRILHCGDFRAHPLHVQHPLLKPETFDPVSGKKKAQFIDSVYLDTTYLKPKYAFPCQEDVISACADVCVNLNAGHSLESVTQKAVSVTGYFPKDQSADAKQTAPKSGRLLVVTGTYSIGKERVCVGIAKALRSKIYANNRKQAILRCLDDAELSSLLTTDPFDAQVHMHTISDMRPDTLVEYLHPLKARFSRVAGFRPTGWVYQPPGSRVVENPTVSDVLYSATWNTGFSVKDISVQPGSSSQSACFEIPYSEHSSFRELTMFCCALRIGRVIPTVNVGSEKSRDQMRRWFDRWETEKKRNGLFKVEAGAERW